MTTLIVGAFLVLAVAVLAAAGWLGNRPEARHRTSHPARSGGAAKPRAGQRAAGARCPAVVHVPEIHHDEYAPGQRYHPEPAPLPESVTAALGELAATVAILAAPTDEERWPHLRAGQYSDSTGTLTAICAGDT